MARFGKFMLAGTMYDLDDLTLNEVALLEETAGATSMSEMDWNASKTMIAASYVLQRRTKPDITLEEAGNVKLIEMIQADEEMPPLPPAVEGDQQNGSVLDASGVQPSPVSTSG